MRGLKKKLIATIASVAVLAGAFTIITKSTYASYDGNEPFLQGGIEFGILANYINQTSDMETNFFAGKYQGNGKHNGNTVPSKANGYGEIRIGELVGELKLRDYDKNKVTIDKKYIREVKDKLASIGEYAESVVNKSDYKIPDIPENTVTNNYYIDISAVDKDVVYVNMDRAMEAVTKGTLSNGAINFTMRKDQTIVLNVTENLELYLPRYIINIKDGSLPKDELAANVIWNMPYLNNLKLESNNMDATVIAPKALVNLAATAEGWLVCDQVVCNNGEWHMIYKGFGKTTKAPTATPTKEPTKEPAKTPKATPTEEPTKAPVKTPSVTSTSEPTKEPTKAPTETPKVTPTVESNGYTRGNCHTYDCGNDNANGSTYSTLRQQLPATSDTNGRANSYADDSTNSYTDCNSGGNRHTVCYSDGSANCHTICYANGGAYRNIIGYAK